MNKKELINSIDATYLKTSLNIEDLNKIKSQVKKNEFTNFCSWPMISSRLFSKQDNVKRIGVFNFPHGMQSISYVISEIMEYSDLDEFDIVLPYRNEQLDDFLFYELESFRNICKDKIIKLIVEHHIHNDHLLKEICNQAIKNKIDYIKTFTGNGKVVDVSHIKKIKDIVGDKIKIKASSGIRTLDQAMELIDAGADRLGIGIDSAINIVKEL